MKGWGSSQQSQRKVKMTVSQLIANLKYRHCGYQIYIKDLDCNTHNTFKLEKDFKYNSNEKVFNYFCNDDRQIVDIYLDD